MFLLFLPFLSFCSGTQKNVFFYLPPLFTFYIIMTGIKNFFPSSFFFFFFFFSLRSSFPLVKSTLLDRAPGRPLLSRYARRDKGGKERLHILSFTVYGEGILTTYARTADLLLLGLARSYYCMFILVLSCSRAFFLLEQKRRFCL